MMRANEINTTNGYQQNVKNMIFGIKAVEICEIN